AENALSLPELEAAERVTLLNTVPSAAAELLRTGTLPSGVRVVALAGEALPLGLVQALYAQEHVQAVWNLYGPTEDTTYSTGVLLSRELRGAPPIGRPLPNTQVYLLD